MTILTDHARERIRKRIGTDDRAQQFANEALRLGVPMELVKGDFRRWLTQRNAKHGSRAGVRIHRGRVWVHQGGRLITVFAVPTRFYRVAQKLCAKACAALLEDSHG